MLSLKSSKNRVCNNFIPLNSVSCLPIILNFEVEFSSLMIVFFHWLIQNRHVTWGVTSTFKMAIKKNFKSFRLFHSNILFKKPNFKSINSLSNILHSKFCLISCQKNILTAGQAKVKASSPNPLVKAQGIGRHCH